MLKYKIPAFFKYISFSIFWHFNKILYFYSGDNSIENLISLCRKRHMKEEQKLRKELGKELKRIKKSAEKIVEEAF